MMNERVERVGGIMIFFDNTIHVSIELEEKEGNYTVSVDGREFSLPLSAMVLSDSPEWVTQDVIKLLVRKELRKKRLDDLTSDMMSDTQKEKR